VKDGAERVNTPCEVVQACDITFSCVSDPTALKDVWIYDCFMSVYWLLVVGGVAGYV